MDSSHPRLGEIDRADREFLLAEREALMAVLAAARLHIEHGGCQQDGLQGLQNALDLVSEFRRKRNEGVYQGGKYHGAL